MAKKKVTKVVEVQAIQRLDGRFPDRPLDLIVYTGKDLQQMLNLSGRSVRSYQLQGLLGQRSGQYFDGDYLCTAEQLAWFKANIWKAPGRPKKLIADVVMGKHGQGKSFKAV